MRRIFSLFKNPTETTQTMPPSLPSGISYSELNYKTNRGFLAKKIGQYLGLSATEGDTLFYQSLEKISFIYPYSEGKDGYILSLSELMLEWSKQNQDIVQQINNLDIEPDYKNSMLKAYELYKWDLFPLIDNAKTGLEKTVIHGNKVDEKWAIYRDVIFAATQEKMLLITKEEVSNFYTGSVLCEGVIKTREDIPVCRNLAKEKLELEGINHTTIMGWLLVLSEAITNTIKHAEEGKMTILKDEKNNEIRFVIEDTGPGFSLKELPKTTLLAGYSTKKSMGQGFTLMMKMANQVLLFTSPKGSTIILTFDSNLEKVGNINATG